MSVNGTSFDLRGSVRLGDVMHGEGAMVHGGLIMPGAFDGFDNCYAISGPTGKKKMARYERDVQSGEVMYKSVTYISTQGLFS